MHAYELPAVDQDPLAVLISAEDDHEVSRRWMALLGRVTPRQREILRCLVEADAGGSRRTFAEVARKLGVASSTVRVQWKRMVDEVRAVPL